MNERWTKLFEVSKETKNALYAEWKKNRYFEDCNNFFNAGQGIISEAMGLTSVMLLYNCFAEEKDVFEKGVNDPETLDIINTSLEYIYKTVLEDGYIVSPLREADETKGVIDKNNAYVDTLTWVLSSAVLIVYAVRNGIISIDPALENKAIELMSDSLAHLISGQLESGAWGFSTNSASTESLYFTYAAAASLADFFDYILGELVYYDNDENQKQPESNFYDWQTVNAINNYYKENPKPVYPNVDITEAVKAARSKLQIWLLRNCLPLLPKIAECTPLTDDEKKNVGMPKQTTNEDIENLGGKDYINLYYAYYIIDILTTSNSDKRYKKIATGTDEEKVTLDSLTSVYKDIMSVYDYSYFFEDAEQSIGMFDEYINQAIHSSRTNFNVAMRSGDDFWSSEKSELIIKWNCDNKLISKKQIENARGGDASFKEPALVPMALRANAVYCYYIIERADVTVDKLLKLICDDRSDETKTTKKNTKIKDLWDNTNYSLPVTERAIEALVDYSDYLSRTSVESLDSAQEIIVTSIDDAIDKKIEKYLNSEEGTKLLESKGYVRKDNIVKNDIDEDAISKMIDMKVSAALSEKMDALLATRQTAYVPEIASVEKSANAGFDADMYIRELENVQHFVAAQRGLPDRDSKDYCERLAYAFIETYKLISHKALLGTISELTDDDLTAEKDLEKISDQFKELFDLIVKNYDTSNGNIASIYRYLMSCK